MVLPNRVDMRTKLARTLLDDLAEEHTDALAPTFVPQSQDIKNAQHDGRTIFALEEPSSTAQRARDAYEESAATLLDRLKQPRAEVS